MSLMGFSYPSLVGEKSEEKEGKKKRIMELLIFVGFACYFGSAIYTTIRHGEVEVYVFLKN